MSSDNKRARGGIPIPRFGLGVDVSPSSLDGVPDDSRGSHKDNKTTTKQPRKQHTTNNHQDDDTSKTAPSKDNSSTNMNMNIPAQWKVSALMQLEVSLQHWFRKQNKTRMSLEDFFALVKKLDWTQTSTHNKDDTTTTTSTSNNNQVDNGTTKDSQVHSHDSQVNDFDWDERLLHDLLCVAANPALKNPLYKLRLEDRNNPTNDHNGSTTAARMELLPHSSDQLRKVLSMTPCIDKAWSDTVRNVIVAYQSANKSTAKLLKKSNHAASTANAPKANDSHNAAALGASSKQQPQQQQAKITPGMTLDERVHARAKAKQEHEQQQQQYRKDANNNNNNNNRSSLDIDTTWMVQLADALWTHARSILQRQNRHLPGKLASNSLLLANNPQAAKRQRTANASSTTNRCVLTFEDVIRTISKSRLGEASSVQIAKVLTEMERFEPRWIVVIKHSSSDAPTTKDSSKQQPTNHQNSNNHSNNSFKWNKKTTTIFVIPDNYPAVRSQLLGEPVTTSAPKIDTTGKQQPVIDGTTRSSAVNKAAAPLAKEESTINRKRPSPVASKNLLEDFDKDSKRIKTATTTTATTNNTQLKQAPPSSSPFSPLSPTTTTTTTTSNSAVAALSNMVAKKRDRDDSTLTPPPTTTGAAAAAASSSSTTTTSSPPKSPGSPKRKKRLRINPHFILNDADYTGGEVLPTSVLDAASPRGLKRLFLQLNAGKRI